MRIDITIIDNCIINKNKQFHQFDETAYAFYVIVSFGMVEKVGVYHNGYLSRIHYMRVLYHVSGDISITTR